MPYIIKMISRSHITVQQSLLDVFNKICLSGSFPDSWRCAHVISFSKPRKDEAIIANFRPISLTNNVGKLMEKMVNVRLTHYLESNKCIPRGQYGFRKMLGTTDAILQLTADVQASLSCGHQVFCVSFDLQKAYGTTWKRGILKSCMNLFYEEQWVTILRAFLPIKGFKQKLACISLHLTPNKMESLRAAS